MSRLAVVEVRSRCVIWEGDGMSCCGGSSINVIEHKTGDSYTYRADLGNMLLGETITGVTSITADDTALSVSGLAVLSADTVDYDRFGNQITIEANTGVSWIMSGGTAGLSYEDYTATLVILVTTASGTRQADIRVKVS